MSDLTRLRSAYSRAWGQVSRWERELANLRDQYREAGNDERTELTRRGQALHIVLDGAKQDLERARTALATEERRLLEPGAKIRTTLT